MKLTDYIGKDVRQVSPFSNGTEAMIWEGENCDRCTRACNYKEPPDFGATLKLVNLGMECKMRLAIHLGYLEGSIAYDMAALIGFEDAPDEGDASPAGCTLKRQCMMFSDNEDDRFKPRKGKPWSPPDNQMCMPFVMNEIQAEPVKQELELEHAR